MITKNTIYALGVFANSQGIEQAINELKTANFPMEKVSVIAKDADQGDRVGETQISDGLRPTSVIASVIKMLIQAKQYERHWQQVLGVVC